MEQAVVNLLSNQKAILLQQLAEIEKVMARSAKQDYQIHKRALKKGFKYYAQYWGEDGKRIKSKFSLDTTDENIAHNRAKEWKEKFLNGHYSNNKKGGAFYALLSGYYAEGSKLLTEALNTNRHLEEKQIKTYKSFIDTHFIPFLKQEKIKRIEDFKTKHIRLFQAYLEGKYTPKTINKNINGSIKKLFDHLLINGVIKETPFPKGVSINIKSREGDIQTRKIYPINRLFDVLFEVNMWKMFKSEKDYQNDKPKNDYKKKYLYCLIGATTGLRNGEIHFLRKSSIIKKGGIYFLNIENSRINKSGLKTKSSKRKVPLHRITYNAIMDYIKENEIKDYLFYKEGQKSINYDTYKDANIECGIHCGYTQKEIQKNNVDFYSFRHFYKTILVQGGLPKEISRHFMGHAKNKRDMEDNYSHIEDIGNDDKDNVDDEYIAQNGKKVIDILDAYFNNAYTRHIGENEKLNLHTDMKEVKITNKANKTFTFLTGVIYGYESFTEIENEEEE